MRGATTVKEQPASRDYGVQHPLIQIYPLLA